MIRRVARGLTARAVVRRRNRCVVGSTSRRRPWSVSTPIWLESPRRPKTMRRGARRPMISMSTSPIARGTDRPSARSRWTTPTDRTPRARARVPGMHVYVEPVSTSRRSRTSRPFGPRNVASAYTSPIGVLRGIFAFIDLRATRTFRPPERFHPEFLPVRRPGGPSPGGAAWCRERAQRTNRPRCPAPPGRETKSKSLRR